MSARTDIARLVADAKPAVFWSDSADAPGAAAPVHGTASADLVIIGAGYSGLWAALQAVEESPGRSVIVLEAEVAGFGASSRNGGFCDASLTHGLLNGLEHWPTEIDTLVAMGQQNLAEIMDTIDRHDIDAHAYRADEVDMAVAQWQLAELDEAASIHADHGASVSLVDQSGARSIVDSPTYLGGLVHHDSIALVDPARLIWGLRDVCERLGVVFHESSRVTGVEADGTRLRVSTAGGHVIADRVIAATNAWAEPLKKIRRWIIPVYDHVLMTEPLSAAQMDAVGWSGREGLADAANQFHYYRLTHDNRILWGGYDANYYKGNGMGPEYERQTESHETIARHFFDTFPQLDGLGFSHRWAGPIGTTTKFSPTWGTEFDGRLAWVGGYTGLGVGASRFGARVCLDLIDGNSTERTALAMVRTKPMPFPPEPLRNAVIQFTRSQITKADANNGEPGPWLRLLSRLGIGFDS